MQLDFLSYITSSFTINIRALFINLSSCHKTLVELENVSFNFISELTIFGAFSGIHYHVWTNCAYEISYCQADSDLCAISVCVTTASLNIVLWGNFIVQSQVIGTRWWAAISACMLSTYLTKIRKAFRDLQSESLFLHFVLISTSLKSGNSACYYQ